MLSEVLCSLIQISNFFLPDFKLLTVPLGFKHTSITYYVASIIDYFAQVINKLIAVVY
jgi:hypothetical protein